MTKPSNFIMNTDYATLKNDAKGTLTVVLPASTSVAGATVASWTDTITIGEPGSSIRARIMSTKNNVVYCVNSVGYAYSTGGSGPGTDYLIYATVLRISPTQIRLSVLIPNQYGSTQNITGLSQTISATVATFIPPVA